MISIIYMAFLAMLQFAYILIIAFTREGAPDPIVTALNSLELSIFLTGLAIVISINTKRKI